MRISGKSYIFLQHYTYTQVLSLRNSAMRQTSSGQIIDLMTSDLEKIDWVR